MSGLQIRKTARQTILRPCGSHENNLSFARKSAISAAFSPQKMLKSPE
jgi:hypothetical protein